VGSDQDAAAEWWRRRRGPYNLGLAVSGVLAFVCYCAVVWTVVLPKQPDAEISGFTTAVQGMGYLVMMGLANLCYSLGLLCERLLHPENPLRFRRISYSLGCAFSFALPFAIPLSLLVFGPAER